MLKIMLIMKTYIEYLVLVLFAQILKKQLVQFKDLEILIII